MRSAIPLFLFGCALIFSACVQPGRGATGGPSLPVSTRAPAPTTSPPPVSLPTETAPPIPTVAIEIPQTTPTPVAEDNSPVDSELLELGKAVYRQQTCGVCHTLTAIGSLGSFGPPQDNLATIAAERIHEARYKGGATTAEEYIRESIVNPQAFFVDGYQITRFPMPLFTNLSEREVDALVHLLMQPPAAAAPQE